MFPPGRARLRTSPTSITTQATGKTIGIRSPLASVRPLDEVRAPCVRVRRKEEELLQSADSGVASRRGSVDGGRMPAHLACGQVARDRGLPGLATLLRSILRVRFSPRRETLRTRCSNT